MPHEKDIVLRHPKDPAALLDVIRDVQNRLGHVSEEAVSRIASHVKLAEAEVRKGFLLVLQGGALDGPAEKGGIFRIPEPAHL
jgi:hypothetical protein